MGKICSNTTLMILAFFQLSLIAASPYDETQQDPYQSRYPIYSIDTIKSGASLGYLFGDDIDIVGTLYSDFPFIVRNEKSAFLNLNLTNTVSKADDDISFAVRDFDYRITIGARDYLTKKLIVSAFVSQQGFEKADVEGSAYVRYVGFAMESESYRDFNAERGLSWHGEIGAIFANKKISGEMTFKGDARFNYLLTERMAHGIDFTIDSLINDFNTSNDWKIGPRITFCNSCSSAPSAFIYYMNNKNPLGFGDDGFIVGFDYKERSNFMNSAKMLPEIHGNLSAGAGQGREETRVSLKFRSPDTSIRSGLRIAFDIDTFILTADDTGNLYYFLNGGLEREWKDLVEGVYFYHRSNHQLAEPNDRITSMNVIEAGFSSKGWDRQNIMDGIVIDIGHLEGAAVMNFLLRAGFLLNSSFGEERKWNLKAGTRIDFPIGTGRFSPFISASWEGGDTSRKEFSAGFRTPLDLDLLVQYKKDKQYYGSDNDVFLVLSSLSF